MLTSVHKHTTLCGSRVGEEVFTELREPPLLALALATPSHRGPVVPYSSTVSGLRKVGTALALVPRSWACS